MAFPRCHGGRGTHPFRGTATYFPDLMTQLRRRNMKCNGAIMPTDTRRRGAGITVGSGNIEVCTGCERSRLLSYEQILAGDESILLKVGEVSFSLPSTRPFRNLPLRVAEPEKFA